MDIVSYSGERIKTKGKSTKRSAMLEQTKFSGRFNSKNKKKVAAAWTRPNATFPSSCRSPWNGCGLLVFVNRATPIREEK